MEIKDAIKLLHPDTTAEAIAELEHYGGFSSREKVIEVVNEACVVACDALKKQIPTRPIGTYTDYKCPVCGRRVRSGKGSSSRSRDNFCQRCGQSLDWS